MARLYVSSRAFPSGIIAKVTNLETVELDGNSSYGSDYATSMDAQFEKATFVFCWAYRLRNNMPVIRYLLRCDMSVGV